MATRSPLKLSPMHRQHLEMGASMVEADGWQRPARYSSVEDEVERLTGTVGFCDVSPSVKLRLQGAEVESWPAQAAPELGRLDIGAVGKHRLAAVARLTTDEFLIIAEPNRAPSIYDTLGVPGKTCAHIVDISSALAGVAIAGPSARLLLEAVTDLDVSPQVFPDLRCAQAGFVEVHGTLLRLDIGDLPYYEVYFGREFAEYVWDALTEAGEEFEAVPFGTDSMALLRKT